jgi:hypothetical protein
MPVKPRSGNLDDRVPHQDPLAFGEWLHGRLVEKFGLETEAWAGERVRRCERQLQVKRAPRSRMTVEILWLGETTAFTAPGRYVYISRELLERAASDDPVAFILAHEMAHHDLGHLDLLGGRGSFLQRVPFGTDVALLIRAAEWFLISPEAESDADAYALDLCVRAGFDGRKCLEVFDILEAVALDHRAIDAVFGSGDQLDESVTGIRRWSMQAKRWGAERIRRYKPIRERKEDLLARLPA